MNFLLGALLLVLLLLPGFIFRLGYLAKAFSSKSFHSSFLEELIFSLLPAFFLETLGYLIVKNLVGVNERAFLALLINSEKSTIYDYSSREIGLFSLYLLVLTLCALGLGYALRHLAIRTHLHLKYPLFRIYNDWQIYLDGYILDYPNEPGDRRDVYQKWLDVMVENKEGSYIYSGFLNEYVLGKDESLSRLYLTAVRRRALTADRPASDNNNDSFEIAENTESEVNYNAPENSEAVLNEAELSRFYFMPGEYFMIPGSEIRNINITYYNIEVTNV